MNYIDLPKTMKATVLEASTGWEKSSIVLYSCCGIFAIILWRIRIASTKPDYGQIVTFLKGLQGIESEDAGETSSSYLFNISVSAVTQHFDLNGFVQKMNRLGCSVLSTADTNNPSFRTLTVQVPKRGRGIGLPVFVCIGCLLGTVLAGCFYKEEVYKIFPIVETILGNVQEKTR